jgi:hypothetical protein
MITKKQPSEQAARTKQLSNSRENQSNIARINTSKKGSPVLHLVDPPSQSTKPGVERPAKGLVEDKVFHWNSKQPKSSQFCVLKKWTHKPEAEFTCPSFLQGKTQYRAYITFSSLPHLATYGQFQLCP